jgi:hypothetical protein
MKRLASLLICVICASCSKPPRYDASSPQAAVDAMHQMIVDGHPEQLKNLVHIEARQITYADGVTEASAIQDVIDKAGEMFGQLYRVARKLRDRYPDQVTKELQTLDAKARRDGFDQLTRFLADPFGLMNEQRARVAVEDLGDGTAAILIDGKPALGFGMQMREVDGAWKVDVPIDMLQRYRPNTREEWTVIVNMMLSFENSLSAFETELDRGDFRNLNQASTRAGRLLGERALVQVLIYQNMKHRLKGKQDQPKTAS